MTGLLYTRKQYSTVFSVQRKSALPELNSNVIVANQEFFFDEQDKQIHVICYYLLSIALLIHSL